MALFDFQRLARQPDGRELAVALSQACAQSSDMPKVAFFVSENREQRACGNSTTRGHANGATGIVAVYLASPDLARDAAIVGKMFASDVGPIPVAAIGLPVVWPELSVS